MNQFGKSVEVEWQKRGVLVRTSLIGTSTSILHSSSHLLTLLFAVARPHHDMAFRKAAMFFYPHLRESRDKLSPTSIALARVRKYS